MLKKNCSSASKGVPHLEAWEGVGENTERSYSAKSVWNIADRLVKKKLKELHADHNWFIWNAAITILMRKPKLKKQNHAYMGYNLNLLWVGVDLRFTLLLFKSLLVLIE
jgi:hypothetical protein